MSESKKEETQKETGPITLSEAEAEAAVAKAEFEAAKEEAKDAKPDDGTLRTTTISDAVATSEAAAVAEAAYEAAKEKAKAARTAFLASRTNTMLSIPMLMSMVGAGHGFLM